MRKKKKPTWIIKLEQETGGSRWWVRIWRTGDPASQLIEVRHRDEYTAREWAEKIATSWEAQGDAWEVDQYSM